MSANLDLTFKSATKSAPNTVLDLSGEYCFGQDWGCQNATAIDQEGLAVPITLPAGHLVELFGNISDSTFDGRRTSGRFRQAKPGALSTIFTSFLGACGIFAANLNSQGFSNPAPLATAGFPPTHCTWRACPWNTTIVRVPTRTRLHCRRMWKGSFLFQSK